MASDDELRRGGPIGVADAANSVPPPSFGSTAAPPPPPATNRAPRSRSVSPKTVRIAGLVAVLGAVVAGVLVLQSSGRSPERSIAEAIDLHPSDLPGFTVEASHDTGTGGQINAQLTSCLGVRSTATHVRPTLANIASPRFTSGSGLLSEQVMSRVAIRPTPATALADMADTAGRPTLRCVARALDGVSIPTSSGVVVSIGDVHLQPLAPAVPRADASVGVRTTLTMRGPARSVSLVIDLLMFAVGKDEISLWTTAIDHPFSGSGEHQLVSLMVGRALARPH